MCPSRSTQGYMFSGTHVLADAAFADLPEEGCVIRTAYRYWVDAGAPVYAIVDDSPMVGPRNPRRVSRGQCRTSLMGR